MLFSYSDNTYLVPTYEVLIYVLYGEVCVYVCYALGKEQEQTGDITELTEEFPSRI